MAKDFQSEAVAIQRAINDKTHFHGIQIMSPVNFSTSGDFTVCHVMASIHRSDRQYTINCYGATKKHYNDRQNLYLAQKTAFKRAVRQAFDYKKSTRKN